MVVVETRRGTVRIGGPREGIKDSRPGKISVSTMLLATEIYNVLSNTRLLRIYQKPFSGIHTCIKSWILKLCVIYDNDI